MEPLPPAAGRRSRLLLAGAALLVLVAIVAFASRSGFGGSAKTTPTKGFVDWAFSLFIVLFVLAIPATIYAMFFSGERPERQQKERGFGARVLRNLAIVAFVLFAIAGYYYLKHHHHLHGLHLNFGAGAGAKGGGHKPTVTQPLSFQWPVLLVAVGLIAATVAMWLTLRRQRKPYERVPLADAPNRLADDVAASIADALDDLEAEPDARRAVVAAYARMETMLARSGLRRSPSETPLEYLQRVLLGLTARADAVRTLTGLFEEARFSSHEIGESMKQAAIAALSAIRDDLQSAQA